MAGGRGDRGLYDGRNVSGARMWLEVGKTEDFMMDAMYRVYQDVAASSSNRGQYGGGNVSEAKMWLEVGEM